MKTETKVGLGVALALLGYYLYNKSKSTPQSIPQPTKLVEKIKTNSVLVPTTPVTTPATSTSTSNVPVVTTATETIAPVLAPIIAPIVAPIIPIVTPPAASPLDEFIPPTPKVEPISNPIIDIIIPPATPTKKGGIEIGDLDQGEYVKPTEPIYQAPPIYIPPPTPTPEPEKKGSIEIGELDKGEYGGGGGNAPELVYIPPFVPPLDIFIPPAPTPELKGTIEIGQLDQGQYGPAEDTNNETPKISLDTFDRLLYNPQPNGSGGGGGGQGGDGGGFGGGGGSFGSGTNQSFLLDWIWFPTETGLKGSIEIGDLDQGQYE
jgi:hypothetical protein